MENLSKLNVNGLGSDHFLGVLKNPLRISSNREVEDLESMGFELGFTTLIISDKSRFDDCLAKFKNFQSEVDPQDDETDVVLMEFKVDDKFLTVAWSSPDETFPQYVHKENSNDSLFLDELSIDGSDLFDNNDNINEKKNAKFKKALASVVAEPVIE